MVESAGKLPVKKAGAEPGRAVAAQAIAQFEGLREEIDRLFDDFGQGIFRLPLARSLFRAEPFQQGVALPAVDAVETDKDYRLTAELPGLEAKDIEVKLANGTLTIRGEKKSQKEETKGDYYLSERHYGSFERSFAVPQGVDREAIEARFDKGVLTLTLPKTPEAQKPSKTIEVKPA